MGEFKATHRFYRPSAGLELDVILTGEAHPEGWTVVQTRGGGGWYVGFQPGDRLEPIEPATVTGAEAWDLLQRGAVLMSIQSGICRRYVEGQMQGRCDATTEWLPSGLTRKQAEVLSWTIVEPPKPESAFVKALKRQCDEQAKAGILTRDVGWTIPALNADDYLFRAGDGTSRPHTDDSRGPTEKPFSPGDLNPTTWIKGLEASNARDVREIKNHGSLCGTFKQDDSRDSGDAAADPDYSFDIRGYATANLIKATWGHLAERESNEIHLNFRPSCHVCEVTEHEVDGKLVPLEGKLCNTHLAAWELVDTPLHRARDFESWCRRERLKGQVEACRASKDGA